MQYKFFLSVVIISIVCLFSGSMAYCESLADSVEGGLYGLLTVPSKDNFDTTGGGGGYLRYYVTENIAVEAAMEYSQWDFSTTVSGATGTLSGDLDVIPLMGTLQYHYLVNDNLHAYVGGGISGFIIDGSATGTLSVGGGSKIDFDNAIGGHLSGGLNWNATENLLLNVDLKYTWVTSETTESTSTAGTALVYEDMDLTNLGLRGGLSYKF